MKCKLLAAGVLSTILLTACGGEKDTYTKEEVEKLVKDAVTDAQANQLKENEVSEEEFTQEGADSTGIDKAVAPTVATSSEGPIRGALISEKHLPDPMELLVNHVTDNGYKVYEMNSRVLHNDLEIRVDEFEIIKYLESDFTSNVFRADEGISYVIVYITGQNMGDRATRIRDNVFINDLLITDSNGETIKAYTDGNKSDLIAQYYLEQFGAKRDIDKTIERNGYFTHVIGYEVSDEYLQPGNQLWLRQDSSWVYGGDTYKLPFYEIKNDFVLPVVDDKYK